MWLLAISVWGAPRQATASEAYQQRRERISVSFRNASLAEVLQRIKQQTGYYILYNSDAVRGIGGISFSKADAPVREVLDEALRGTRLEYSIDDDTIVIRGRSGGGNASAPQKAPDKVVSGRVTDTAGAPLVGVNILIQGTATGVVSGSDGGFSIRMPEGRDNLIFSYIGYVSQTLPSAQTRLVRLVQDEQEIENVVVTGIFTRKKESYTGSATTITSGQLARVSNRNVFESLKNIEPSLYIMDNTLMGSDPNTLPATPGRSSRPSASRASTPRRIPRRRWISPNATTHSKRRCSADWTPTGSQNPCARASATNTPSRSNWATAASCGR